MTAAAALWLGVFPLLHGGTYARLTLDKWIIFLILTGVTLLCFLADLFLRRLSRPRLLPLLAAAGLLLWTVLSCLLSPYSPDLWWIGTSSRREGLAAQLCYLALFFLFSCSRVRLRPVLYAAVAGVAAFLVIVLLQRAGGNPFGLYPAGRSYATNYEFQGTVGNIDVGVGYLLILSGLFLPPVLRGAKAFFSAWHGTPGRSFSFRAAEGRSFSFRPSGAGTGGPSVENTPGVPVLTPWEKADFWVSLSGLLICICLILTMGVQFGFLTLLALAVAAVLFLLPKKYRLPLLIFLIIAALLVVWFWPGQSGGLWELHEILHGRLQLSFGSNRVAVWTYSLSLAGEDRLFLGSGSDTFALRFNQYIKEKDLVIPVSQGKTLLPHYFDTPHCDYLAQLLNHGLPALLLFLALILFTLFPGKKHSFSPDALSWRAAVFCYAVQAIFVFSVCIIAPMFWVVLGAGASASGESASGAFVIANKNAISD